MVAAIVGMGCRLEGRLSRGEGIGQGSIPCGVVCESVGQAPRRGVPRDVGVFEPVVSGLLAGAWVGQMGLLWGHQLAVMFVVSRWGVSGSCCWKRGQVCSCGYHGDGSIRQWQQQTEDLHQVGESLRPA